MPGDRSDCLTYEYRPRRLYVNLTNRCNNQCVFCARTRGEYRLGSFDLRLARDHPPEDYVAAVEQRCAAGPRPLELVFCGYGEPTLRLPELLEIARWAKDRALPVRLNTNGQAELIHGSDVVSRLAGLIDRVNVSLNAPDELSYVRTSCPQAGGEAWGWVVGFLRRSVRYLPEAWASVVGHALTAEEVSASYQLAAFCGSRLRVR